MLLVFLIHTSCSSPFLWLIGYTVNIKDIGFVVSYFLVVSLYLYIFERQFTGMKMCGRVFRVVKLNDRVTVCGEDPSLSGEFSPLHAL